jgi:hypothetical protein
MRDKFRDNPANSDRFHADYCYIGTVSAASSIWRILGSGRRAGTLRGCSRHSCATATVSIGASDVIADGHRRFEGAQAPVCRGPLCWCRRGWAGRSGAGQGRLYRELSPVVMAGQAIQQVVNFLAGDVGEFAGGCALGRRSRGLRVS